MAEPTSTPPTPTPPTSTPPTPDPPATAAPSRRGPDPIALLVGLVTLTVAGLAMAAPGVLVAVDPRWVLAGAAVVVGVGALLAALRRSRRP